MGSWVVWAWLLDLSLAALVVWLVFERRRGIRRVDGMARSARDLSAHADRMRTDHQAETERHLASQQRLRELLQLMDTLIHTIPNPVFFKDDQGLLQGCNRAFEETIMGLSRERIIGRSATDFAHRIASIADDPTPDGANGVFESEVLCADGVKREYLLYTAPVRAPGGPVTGSIGVMLDLSERNRAVKERLEREKFQGVLETAGAVCHELNQPLQILSGYAEMAELDGLDPSRWSELAGRIQEQVRRMADITQKLQRLTRYETMTYGDRLKIIDIHKSSA